MRLHRRGLARLVGAIVLVGVGAAGTRGALLPKAHRAEAVASSRVTYRLQPDLDHVPRRLLVTMRIPTAAGAPSVQIQMPVWSPGDYHVQDHARYVGGLRARAGDAAGKEWRDVAVRHPDSNTWEVPSADAAQVEVSYTLSGVPPGIFSQNVQLLPRQVFVNGPSALCYVVGHKSDPVEMIVAPPAGWSVETPLARASESAEAVVFEAPDYDTLADSPLLMAAPGAVDALDFTLDGVGHRAAFFGALPASFHAADYLPVLKAIALSEGRIMRSRPYPRYEFFFDVGGFSAGLEHLNACRIGMEPDIPAALFAPFVAHEFFHLWNVKRIRPRVLGPFDYIHPPRTRNLWFAEGVTEYYAYVAVRRAGLDTPQAFLDHWRGEIARMEHNPARLRITADEASWHVWETGDSASYQGLSYYEKGELIGLCLDLEIRHATAGKRSLDDVMRLLMARHAPPRAGYEEDEIRATVSEVAGQDISALYDRLARSTEEMPFARCLGHAGLTAELTPLAGVSSLQAAIRNAWLEQE